VAPKNPDLRYWIFLGLIVALGLPNACQNDSPVTPDAGSDIRIDRVEVARTVLSPGDSTSVRAWVVRGPDPGYPVPQAAVEFGRLLDNQAGGFSKAEDLTDSQGWASTVYRASAADSGLVTLRISVEESIEYVLLHVTDEQSEGIFVSLETQMGQTGLPADGREDLEITARAFLMPGSVPIPNMELVLVAGDDFIDVNGNGIFDGEDRLSPGGDRAGNGQWDAEGSLPESATTDAQGRAVFSYRAGTTVGPVYVRASGNGYYGILELQQHSLTLNVSLVLEARELLADGVSQTQVGLLVSDWSGAPVQGVLLKLVAGEPFTDVDGSGFYTSGIDSFEDLNGNGRWDALGSITSVVTTSSSGTATAMFQAGLEPGTVTIKATNTQGAVEKELELLAVPPASLLQLELERGSIRADGVSTVAGTVTVRDLNGMPLAGKEVTLSAGERFLDADGDGVSAPGVDYLLEDSGGSGAWADMGSVPSRVTTGIGGVASFTYQAGLEPGEVWISATVDGVSTGAPILLEELPAIYSMEVAPAVDRLTVSGGGGLDNTRITATCLDGQGQPVPAGVPVSFRIVSGPGGGENLEGALDGSYRTSTNSQGKASAVLLAGTSPGLVQVGASSGGIIGSTGIYITAGLAASISCRADSVSLNENESTQVYAYVYDQSHNAVRDGTVVMWHADEGLIFGEHDEGSSRTRDGVAVATFVAVPNQPGGDGTAAVTAETNGGIHGGISCTTYVEMPPEPQGISRIQLTSVLPEIAVMGTGGVEQTVLRAHGFDPRNRSVSAGRSITFSISQGPGGGEHLSCAACEEVEVLTDAAGVAQVVLASGTVSGTVVVTARSTEREEVTAHTPVGIAAGPPHYISCGVEYCNVLACGFVNTVNEVVALVSDIYRNPVRDGTAVYFTTSHGQVEGDQGLATALTNRGLASATWRSDGTCGIITVSAATSGGSLTADTRFIGSGPAYSAAFTIPDEPSVDLNADGRSSIPLRIEVRDANGHYTLPGEVEITATYGEIRGLTETTDGCNASIARAEYVAPVLERDDSYTVPDDGLGATDIIRVSAGFGPVGDLMEVRLRTGNASASNSSIDIGTVPPGMMSIFGVTVRDRFGNPLGGHRLAISASAGTVDSTAVTNEYGMATGLRFYAPQASGTVLLEVVDEDPNHGGGMILRNSVTVEMP